MPIYEYLCPRCKKVIEVIQKINDPSPLCSCEKNNLIEMSKQISLGSFILKGQGWFRDGYSKKDSVKK